MAYQCSLIINVYNQGEELRLILDSVSRQSVSDFEVIIADDGSSDHTTDVIKDFQYKHPQMQLKHIWHEDTGYTKPIIFNKSVRHAATDYLIFLDGDMILHPRFIEQHLRFRQPKKVMVGGRGVKLREHFVEKLKNGEAKLNFDTISLIQRRLRGELTNWLRACVIENRLLRKLLTEEKGRLTGCNFALYKDAWIAVNGMDNTIREFGFNDFELGCRLQRAGYELVDINLGANAFHMEHPRPGRFSRKELTAKIKKCGYTQCKYGYAELEDGSTVELLRSIEKKKNKEYTKQDSEDY